MFKWRRKNEGFEWRDYVRTTILVRRKERRERVKNMQAAAVENLRQAGKASIDGGARGASWAGRSAATASISSLSWLRDTSAKAVSAAAPVIRSVARASADFAARSLEALRPLGERLAVLFSHPGTSVALNVVAAILAFAVILQLWTVGLDMRTGLVALAAALITGLSYASKLRSTGGPSAGVLFDRLGGQLTLLPGFDRLRPRQASFAALLAVAAVGGAGAWLATAPSSPTTASATYTSAARNEPKPEAKPAESTIAGRATAVSGDQLKLQGKILQLDGIEAPEPEQICDGPSGKWKCGAAAKEALARALRGRRVSCEITDTSETGPAIARCFSGETDIAAVLARSGHVFAAAGLFPRYGGEERAAKLAKDGMWAGDAVRPADYRAKRWDEAKRQAPEGCPIKGRVASGSRIYVLPWSPTYDSVRVSSTRGERWFCSEEEAQAAGWKPQTASRG